MVRSLRDKFNNLSIGGRSQSEPLTFHQTLACLVGLGDPQSPSSFVSHEVSPSILCCLFPPFVFSGSSELTSCHHQRKQQKTHTHPLLVSRDANPSMVFCFLKIYLFTICKYTVAVLRYSRRRHQISLQMVVSHHVVAGI